MNKKLLFLFLAFLIVLPCSALTDNDSRGYLNVNTVAYEEYAPNAVEISFSITTKNKNATVASDENKEIASKAIEAIKKTIDTQNGDMIKTKGVNVNAEYVYKNNNRVFEHYKAINSFTVKLKDVEKIGDVINVAVKNGVTSVNNLNYSLEETDNYCTELISRAAKTARQRADVIAKSLGLKVGGIKNANTSCSTENRSYAPRMMFNAKALGASADEAVQESGVPVEAGIIKINANFNADFFIQ